MNYRYCRSEPVVLIEIYLPKRAAFQGPLFDTLTEAVRDPAVIRKHFLDPRHRKQLKEFLAESRPLGDYDAAHIERMPQLLYGFSMYEVDGAFLGRDGEVYEERTQVLRLLFQYATDEDTKRDPDRLYWVKAFFRSPASSVDEFCRLVGGAEKAPRELLERLDTWVNYVWLVVHGFVLFRICRCVDEVSKGERRGKRDVVPHYQEEIWVMSNWTYHISRAVGRKRPRRP